MNQKQQSIPNIQFKSDHSNIEGIEIFTLENLINRANSNKGFDHDPEKAHQLEFYMLVFYTEGKTKQLVDFMWHEVQKNTIIYLVKGQINAFQFNEEVKGFVILFTEEYFKERLSKLPKDTVIRLFTSHLFSPKVKITESSRVIDYIKLFYDEFYREENTFNKKNIINYLYNIVFSKLETLKKDQTFYLQDSSKLEVFLKFKSLVEENFSKSRNAEFYAKKLNITYKHLNVISKAVINSTAKQFIDEVVILEAKRQLINSSIKSTELAYLMGFDDPTNFVKYFKKHTKLTPNSFKNNYK